MTFKPTQHTRQEEVRFISPEGTTVDSLGREPQERSNKTRQSPKGATHNGQSRFCRPVRGLRNLGIEVLGLAPQAISCRHFAAESRQILHSRTSQPKRGRQLSLKTPN